MIKRGLKCHRIKHINVYNGYTCMLTKFKDKAGQCYLKVIQLLLFQQEAQWACIAGFCHIYSFINL